jgi:hypothetical protein
MLKNMPVSLIATVFLFLGNNRQIISEHFWMQKYCGGDAMTGPPRLFTPIILSL